MSEHYSGHDPAYGCGLMMLAAAGLLVAVAMALLVWALWSFRA